MAVLSFRKKNTCRFRYSQVQKELPMKKHRIVKSVIFSAGLTFLLTAAGQASADTASRAGIQTPRPASPGGQQRSQAFPADDFAGLDLNEEQKAQMANIRKDADARKALVTKDEKLSSEQKDAMLLGYTRIEYGQFFKVLTPLQQKVVRDRVAARRSQEQAARKKQPSTPR